MKRVGELTEPAGESPPPRRRRSAPEFATALAVAAAPPPPADRTPRAHEVFASSVERAVLDWLAATDHGAVYDTPPPSFGAVHDTPPADPGAVHDTPPPTFGAVHDTPPPDPGAVHDTPRGLVIDEAFELTDEELAPIRQEVLATPSSIPPPIVAAMPAHVVVHAATTTEVARAPSATPPPVIAPTRLEDLDEPEAIDEPRGTIGHGIARVSIGEGADRVDLTVTTAGHTVRVTAVAEDVRLAAAIGHAADELAGNLARHGLALGDLRAGTGERPDPHDLPPGRDPDDAELADHEPDDVRPAGVRIVA